MSCSGLGLPCFIRSFTYLVALSRSVFSLSVNRTIDDEKGDSVTGVVPSYSPVGSWSQGSTCSGCFIHLDASQTFQGTWHDTTHTPGDPEPRVITAQFTGTAVYVYNVLANTVLYTTTFTSITFTLDGENVGQFVHVPTESTDFQYDVPVFASDNLPNGDHTIVIEANGATNSSLVLFDYIVYTFEDDPITTSSNPVTSSSTTTHANPPATANTDSTATQQTTPTFTSSTTSLVTSGPSPTSQQTSSGSGTSSIPLHSSSGSVSTSSAADGASSSSQSSGIIPTSQGPTVVASTQHSRTAVGAIAGGAAGGALALVLAIILTLCFIRRRRRMASPRPRPLIDSDSFTEAPLSAQRQPMLSNGSSETGISRPVAFTGGSASFTPYARGATGRHTPPTIPTTSEALPSRSTSSLPDSSHNPSGTSTDSPNLPWMPHRPTLPRTAVTNPSLPTLPATFDEDVKIPLDDVSPMLVVQHAPPMMPTAPSSFYARSEAGSVSTTGERSLRAQVAALREEVERLREIREMQEMFVDEAPPSYGES
ncbi:hypothetical protein PYCCODRAFT_649257 [Trametes coccinea BRFM310]|uniref:Uncharacterized protein n=1 Tax=Trametes coccinea (strain BRFM310) TaxID=1353009 RepID=A0A1Y2IIA8_TRAC3|nr:hypothetical protein PYCCODRAFT_649257 [Trametes coccinea BRFM310]